MFTENTDGIYGVLLGAVVMLLMPLILSLPHYAWAMI